MNPKYKMIRDKNDNTYFLYAEDGDMKPAILNHIEEMAGRDIRDLVEEQFARYDEAVEEIAELEAELSRLAELKDVLFESNISLTSSARALEASIREERKHAKALRRANAALERGNDRLAHVNDELRENFDTMLNAVSAFSSAWDAFVTLETSSIEEGDDV